MIDEYAFRGKCGYSGNCMNYLNGCHDCPKVGRYPKSYFFNGAPIIFKMKREAYRRCKKIVFVGPAYTVFQAKKSPLLENKRIEILDEAVNTSFYAPRDDSLLRKELNISIDSIVLVCVAPYSYERDVNTS